MAEGNLHPRRAAARRRRDQGARVLLGRFRCQRRRRHGPRPDDRYRDGRRTAHAVCSDGSYGVEKGLISSFPIRTKDGRWETVQNVALNDFSRAKVDASVAELEKEISGQRVNPLGWTNDRRFDLDRTATPKLSRQGSLELARHRPEI